MGWVGVVNGSVNNKKCDHLMELFEMSATFPPFPLGLALLLPVGRVSIDGGGRSEPSCLGWAIKCIIDSSCLPLAWHFSILVSGCSWVVFSLQGVQMS